jgi:hypothetical protein
VRAPELLADSLVCAGGPWLANPWAMETSPPRALAFDRNLGWIAVAMAGVLATYTMAATWERVKVRPPERSLRITGSAKKRIVSDLIEWTCYVEARNPTDRTAAYKTLHGHVALVLEFLQKQGIKPDEIRPSSASVEEMKEIEHVVEHVGMKNENRVERQIFKGYRTYQSVTIRSTDLARVERASREVTQLLERGVSISSAAPSYYYTKLGEMKLEMLAEAAKNARTRADNILTSAGGAAIRQLRSADMGIINVNPANSTETSVQGNNDTASLEKDIITIVHVTYDLK